MVNSHRQRAFDWPVKSPDAVAQSLIFYAEPFGPLPNGQRFTTVCVTRHAAAIQRLFYCRGPAHIARFIIAIIINALNTQSGARTMADVTKKDREVVAPFGADLNTTSAIILKLRVIRHVAAFFHRTPDCIFWEAGTAVRRLSRYNTFTMVTTAGSRRVRVGSGQRGCDDASLNTAATPTEIDKRPASMQGTVDDRPITKNRPNWDGWQWRAWHSKHSLLRSMA